MSQTADSYNPHKNPERWLLGACSSGDPLRWAVVAVHEKVIRLQAVADAAEAYVMSGLCGDIAEYRREALRALIDVARTDVAVPRTPCGHPADRRCIECATDAELLASVPPFPS